MGFISVVMMGMTFIAMQVWGPYMIEFKNFSDAFIGVLFFQMGLLNFEWMRFYNVIWSFSYIIIYCLFLIYILMSSFMIIFIDSYRRVVLQYGAPL